AGLLGEGVGRGGEDRLLLVVGLVLGGLGELGDELLEQLLPVHRAGVARRVLAMGYAGMVAAPLQNRRVHIVHAPRRYPAAYAFRRYHMSAAVPAETGKRSSSSIISNA